MIRNVLSKAFSNQKCSIIYDTSNDTITCKNVWSTWCLIVYKGVIFSTWSNASWQWLITNCSNFSRLSSISLVLSKSFYNPAQTPTASVQTIIYQSTTSNYLVTTIHFQNIKIFNQPQKMSHFYGQFFFIENILAEQATMGNIWVIYRARILNSN